MAFLALNNIAKFKDNKTSPKIAEVINNNDPRHKGRIKVRLEGMYEPTDSQGSNLPWIRRYKTSGIIGNDVEEFSVPAVGSFVEVFWPFKGSKRAFYKNAPAESNLTENFTEGYPNKWGWCDSSGFALIIDKSEGTFILKTLGCSITGDSAGNITIQGGNVTIGDNTTIDGRPFLSHVHTNGNNGANTGGVV